jgi:hypothetical protein
MKISNHLEQQKRWPVEGRHILAQYDDTSVIVYQAYRPSIARYAIERGRFGGPDFSFQRMSWIKPNFLWMMYRCGWGTKEGQEMILALRLKRPFFDEVLAQAVESSYDPSVHRSREAWQASVESSEVRLQWDPDHSPSGAKQDRRAIQLGLRGRMLQRMAGDDLLEVIDMTGFVSQQRPHAQDDNRELQTPTEAVYLMA